MAKVRPCRSTGTQSSDRRQHEKQIVNFADYLKQCQLRVNEYLTTQMNFPTGGADTLQQAMSYSLMNGGKRVRPVLVYAAAEACGANMSAADRPAAALEMIHSYSLVHDDLPAMDDDDLRRGKPTCHIAYDEATAILAGDALQTLAFDLLSRPSEKLNAQQQLTMIQILAQASGGSGMCAGQSIDLQAVGHQVDLAYLENMHNHKTGALIHASVLMGAHCATDTSEQQLAALSQYAKAIGLAFQVQDDILDVISDTETLGKAQGADIALNKPTYVSLLGLDGAKAKARELHEQARAALAPFGEQAKWLAAVSDYIIERAN